MRNALFAAALAVTITAPAAAQEADRSRPELGVRGGVIIVREGGDGFTRIGLTSSDWIGVGTIHLLGFTGSTFAVEPFVGFNRASSGGFSSGVLTGGMQLNQFFSDPESDATYAFANGGFSRGIGGGGGSVLAAGGGIGYRVIARETLALRLEARYRRLFGDGDGNEFGLLVGFGAIIGAPR